MATMVQKNRFYKLIFKTLNITKLKQHLKSEKNYLKLFLSTQSGTVCFHYFDEVHPPYS